MRENVFLPRFLPLPSIKLGRLLCSVDDPQQDYVDATPPPDSSIIERLETHYAGTESLAKSRDFTSDLTSFLSTSISRRTETSVHITAKEARTYYLDNNSQWFRGIVQEKEVRKWIERVVDEGETIYLVVGYHTVLNAHVVETSKESNSLGGNLTFPVSAALAATGVVIPLGNLIDPSIGSSHERSKDHRRQSIIQGEQIVAVQYRRIKFKFLSSKSIDKATLEKGTRWERYDRPRYLQDDGDDVVEVELEDDLDLEGDWMSEAIGEDEVLFSTNLALDA
ncbi:hypothetical protein N7478_011245 [Penicillium angulare]|uniref:uncharacterized protein n=1 Tax=Penicillium angulare TaxID=116970 RepID=UPI002540F579|nr:uncharacterized protein N7478_011245 [Penicillium angulare]KAJ5263640.1 hypothetical protein N7478_011245 [Penicillium angulare]